ncbi:hypothetical protein BCR44DRAFT_1442092 [Catenaria anguillulae PL171]|uniref:Uncharacterized protein n=1 Tax=Catenaria anguillulae PL171 TaxID=765915 RepID=A0A1Y2HEG5_9FUNG|nr:hypothetical protein BCR44DRAFT_1442092 [Catenaria anguillulae PL171]
MMTQLHAISTPISNDIVQIPFGHTMSDLVPTARCQGEVRSCLVRHSPPPTTASL